VTLAKLKYSNVAPDFSSASELRDALLASYPDAGYFGGAPLIGINRGDETAPAWKWVDEFLRQRTDWWPALGIALQHAARDGGDIARVALADFLELSHDSMVLLEWTEPMAAIWPDVRAITHGTSFGDPDNRIATILAAQRKLWERQQTAPISVGGLEPDGSWVTVSVNTQADLDALLAKSACVGQRRSFDALPTEGPWSWLLSELVLHEWMRPMVPAACAKLAGGTDPEVRAVLDWFTDEHDLWRYVDLLQSWSRAHPPWWNERADAKPPGWKYPVRGWLADHPRTLGDIALAALSRARHQAATPPEIDLAPIFGGRAA
jgi:hypothetical protein